MAVFAAIKLLTDKGFSVKIQINLHKSNMETVAPTVKLLETMGVSDITRTAAAVVPRWLHLWAA
jgi:MoaA/NifB/PqqE/SkfB family radical SAM enzyme